MMNVVRIAPKRILVTDDDSSILRLVAVVLRRAGFEVDTASCGREALEKIRLARYDVLVLDLMMPDLSGHDVLALLEVMEPLRRYVIIMSAAAPDTVASAISLNVCSVLRKPFHIKDLLESAQACIAAQDPPVDLAMAAG
jgi:DNA-binding response OmpR family regulator